MDIIKQLESRPLSSNEISNALGGECKIIRYTKISQYKDIDSFLGPNGCAVILFETGKDFGHWICLFKYPDNKTIEFFDPYGYKPEDEKEFMPREYHGAYNYISRMLYNSPYEVEYNDYPFQQDKEGINTCGRWTISRLLLRDIDINRFIKLFKKSKGINPDILVTLFTENIL